jgi:P-type E1-E2 ATPase
MEQLNIATEKAQDASTYIKGRGDSAVYIAFDKELVGLIAYRDSVRPEAAQALAQLKEQGVTELIVTSGDSGESVDRIAKSIGAGRVYSRLSPEEKADMVRDYQLRGKRVALIGDDVSDALAMAQADLAIAMHDSTDVARYRADIIITDSDLNHLPKTVELSRKAMDHLKQNMLFVGVPNWIGLLLSVTSGIGPVKGTVLNNGSVILAALNDLRPSLDEQPRTDPLN